MTESSLSDQRPPPAPVLPKRPAEPPSRLVRVLRWVPLIVLVGGGLVAFVVGVGDLISLSAIVASRAALLDYVTQQPAVAVAAYCGLYVLAVVFSIPGGSVLTVLGGIMFGGFLAGALTTLSATAGSVAVFLIARTALGDWMRARLEMSGPRLAALAEGFERNAFYVIVVLRLIPVMPYWASNAAPALFNVRLRVFTLATLIGLLPWTVSFAFFGDALDGIVAAQELANPGCAEADTCTLDYSTLMSAPVWTGIVVALLSLVPVGLHWWAKRRRARMGAAGAV